MYSSALEHTEVTWGNAHPPATTSDMSARVGGQPPRHRMRTGPPVIPPLIPPQTPLEQRSRGPLPGPPEPAPGPDDDILFGVSTLGEAGRVLDRYLMSALEWAPGTHLQIPPLDDLLLAGPSPDGPVRVTAEGYFRIPFRQRRRVGLLIGHRVLLTGPHHQTRTTPHCVTTAIRPRVNDFHPARHRHGLHRHLRRPARGSMSVSSTPRPTAWASPKPSTW